VLDILFCIIGDGGGGGGKLDMVVRRNETMHGPIDWMDAFCLFRDSLVCVALFLVLVLPGLSFVVLCALLRCEEVVTPVELFGSSNLVSENE